MKTYDTLPDGRLAPKIDPEVPVPLYIDAALLSDDLKEGDIITLGDPGQPASDWRTGIPIPADQRFRITVKKEA